MKKTILLATMLSLMFGIVQAQTYRPSEARFCLITSTNTAWDTIYMDVRDSAGTSLLDTALTGGGLRMEWIYTIGNWDGQITEEAKIKFTNGDTLRAADIYIVRPIPEIADTIKGFATPADTVKGFLVKGDTTACQTKGFATPADTIKGFLVKGDTTACQAKTVALTTAERGSLADSVWLTPEALDLLFSLAGADSVKFYRPDSLVYYNLADSLTKIFTITNGQATKWITE